VGASINYSTFGSNPDQAIPVLGVVEHEILGSFDIMGNSSNQDCLFQSLNDLSIINDSSSFQLQVKDFMMSEKQNLFPAMRLQESHADFVIKSLPKATIPTILITPVLLKRNISLGVETYAYLTSC
jgi:hypothetical protein